MAVRLACPACGAAFSPKPADAGRVIPCRGAVATSRYPPPLRRNRSLRAACRANPTRPTKTLAPRRAERPAGRSCGCGYSSAAGCSECSSARRRSTSSSANNRRKPARSRRIQPPRFRCAKESNSKTTRRRSIRRWTRRSIRRLTEARPEGGPESRSEGGPEGRSAEAGRTALRARRSGREGSGRGQYHSGAEVLPPVRSGRRRPGNRDGVRQTDR